jgi:hypothetical protein
MVLTSHIAVFNICWIFQECSSCKWWFTVPCRKSRILSLKIHHTRFTVLTVVAVAVVVVIIDVRQPSYPHHFLTKQY